MNKNNGQKENIHNAIRFNVAKKFGPFQICPECYGGLRSCELCEGKGKVSSVEIKAFNNPFAKIARKSKKNKIFHNKNIHM